MIDKQSAPTSEMLSKHLSHYSLFQNILPVILVGGKMNFIIKTILGTLGLYFCVNWMADNPESVDWFRNNMNEATASAIQWVKTTYESG